MNSDKKKIIYVTVRSDHGGGPYHIDLLLSNLSDSFDFYIASPMNEPYGYKWMGKFGSKKFFELPFRSFSLVRFFKLVSFIKINSIGIIHSHGKGAGFYGRLIKIFVPKVKVIHTFHGFHIQEYGFLTRKFYILLEKFLNIFTDLFINVSEGEKHICFENKVFNEKKSVVIYNAIRKINPTDLDKVILRKKLSLHENKFIVISVTRFSFQKNIPLLISISESLIHNERFIFLLIGEGEQRSQIENLIALKKVKNVEILDSRNNIDDYLAASDVYLSTSLWEGMPYSLIEASAAGLPIVASNVIGNNEVVSDNVNGYLFELGNPDKAIEKLQELEKSFDKRKTLGQNSLKVYEEKFQLDKMIKRMKELYYSIAER